MDPPHLGAYRHHGYCLGLGATVSASVWPKHAPSGSNWRASIFFSHDQRSFVFKTEATQFPRSVTRSDQRSFGFKTEAARIVEKTSGSHQRASQNFWEDFGLTEGTSFYQKCAFFSLPFFVKSHHPPSIQNANFLQGFLGSIPMPSSTFSLKHILIKPIQSISCHHIQYSCKRQCIFYILINHTRH